MDRRQNNGSVKAVSPRHCPATSALRNCCFNCRAWAVTRTMSVALLLRNNSKQRSPTFAAQLRLLTHDLFWASLKVQLHLPPLRSLDRLISPGTLLTLHSYSVLTNTDPIDLQIWGIVSTTQAHDLLTILSV